MNLFKRLFGKNKSDKQSALVQKKTIRKYVGQSCPPSSATRKDNDDGFLTSMVVAQATDNAALGYLAGGNITGALIGDMLNNSGNDIVSDSAGCEFGGGGSGGDWNSSSDSGSSSLYDSGSSYSSGSDSSSYDSGSSYDSSSSSSGSSDW